METAVRENDLLALGRLLQERLSSELPLEAHIQVKCVLQNDTLLVLGQNANPVGETQAIFSLLQDSIEALQITFPGSIWEGTEQVYVYLRASGERQPFAVHNFILDKATVSETDSSLESDVSASVDNSLKDIFKWDNAETEEKSFANNINEDTDNEKNIDAPPASEEWQSTAESELSSQEISSEQIPQAKNPDWQLSQSLINIGAGVAVVSFLAGIYAFTRPCVVGGCSVIQTANQLAQSSATNLKNAKSEQDILKGKQNLSKATQQLASIPFWSSYHGIAQKILQNYRNESAKLDPVLVGLDKADLAVQKSQEPTPTLQKWQEIQGLWRGAIASMNKVPPNSPVYPFAQQQLKIYQVNSSVINQEINQEKLSETKLNVAKKTAQLAQVRQGAAKTLNHWQQVQATWEVVIDSLSSIPKTAIVYPEAKQLLDKYEPTLAAARQRRSQEEISANIYNQALGIANLAKNYEQKNQWTQAVASWRRASTYAQQVPENTFFYEQAQPLSDNYMASLRRSQSKLEVAVVIQKARTDLDKTCAGVPKVCEHTVSLQMLKVYLTPAYVGGVKRTAMTAGLSGDAKTLAGVDDHLKTLQAALEAISENANVPLEIYDEKRTMIGRYVPKQLRG